MIDYKWKTFTKQRFLRDFSASMCYTSAFTISTVRFRGKVDAMEVIFYLVTAVLWMYFVYHEIATCRLDSSKENLRDIGKWLQGLGLGLKSTPKTREILNNKYVVGILGFILGGGTWDRLQRLDLIAVAVTTYLDLTEQYQAGATSASFALPLVFMNLLVS